VADAFEDQDWVRTGVAAAMIRTLDSGSQAALETVTHLLTSTLPNRTKQEFTGLFKKRLFRVSVTLGDDVLSLEVDEHGSLVPYRVHTSRGIALKREVWTMAEWVAALVQALEEKAASDAKSRDALANWLRRDM
jgi:hypothetical protein